jgi:acetyltransferase-like isoleucine patch superfamily enzyme|tara:strand:+ start:756 stop:1364 length:609 start_codon:yes stop_codon:yes gene_type:complete
MAGLGLPPAYGKLPLVQTGYAYLSPQARIAHNQFTFEPRCFVSSGVLVYEEPDSGTVHLEADVHLHEFVTIQTGHEGSVRIGERTHVQPRCQFSAYRGSIDIGARVEIAPNCAFYPYNHGMDASIGMQQQPTYTRGGIVIEDEAWLGFGVIVLDGVKVGRGAVIAAGAVVNTDIPEFAIAAGVPAKVVGSRLDEKWRGSAQA